MVKLYNFIVSETKHAKLCKIKVISKFQCPTLKNNYPVPHVQCIK